MSRRKDKSRAQIVGIFRNERPELYFKATTAIAPVVSIQSSDDTPGKIPVEWRGRSFGGIIHHHAGRPKLLCKEEIKKLKQQGLSQTAIALKLGISQKSVSNALRA